LSLDQIDLTLDRGGVHYGTVKITEGFCGTAACIAGHACFIPEFYEAGLRMRVGYNTISGVVYSGVPYFEGGTGIDAMAEFFDIPMEHADILFGSVGGYTSDFYGKLTTENVGKKLREYAENPEILDVYNDEEYDDDSWDYNSWEDYDDSWDDDSEPLEEDSTSDGEDSAE
jgi:hypothetical protein